MDCLHKKMLITIAVIAGAVACVSEASRLPASALPTPALPFNQLVVFGDSLSDVGNLALQ